MVNSAARFVDGGPIPPHPPRRPRRDGPGVLSGPLGPGQAEFGGLRVDDALVAREENR
ncbi:hypothetical protein FHR81_003337 [Actinoalloteichus hoggarensis]|uniref:hypothetical protein n=1 Tax=Actinoalloteichus hoggarensis TaxID=1470176 RepID=UPI00146FC4A4|nr:hypothetical protein [Actinoalloteichus hoggarensis]MBB5922285.1 hypothetical protein [Actinoalloteichus hoggarensis]